MDKKEFEKAIKHYRSIAKKEIEEERCVDGTFIGPKSKAEKEDFKIGDVISPSRPFLGKDAGESLDSTYASTFRLGHYNLPEQIASTGQGTTFVGGMEFGRNLVKENIIKSLDDLITLLADYKIGIVDVFDEKEEDGVKKLDIRVYECIECAGLPNIGRPICYFEAGVITGVFRELTKKDVNAEEKRCWTSGFSFCQFDVEIKD